LDENQGKHVALTVGHNATSLVLAHFLRVWRIVSGHPRRFSSIFLDFPKIPAAKHQQLPERAMKLD
jgi:hypothetical protein